MADKFYSNSEINIADNFRRISNNLKKFPIPRNDIFYLYDDYKIMHIQASSRRLDLNDIEKNLDNIDYKIIKIAATFKYITSVQVWEFLTLNGCNEKLNNINNRLKKMENNRVIQKNRLYSKMADSTINYIELDIFGYIIAKNNNVLFHKGNEFISYKEKCKRRLPDETPEDILRTLAGTQTILGLLVSNAAMERFGVHECFNSINSVFRTSSYIRIDKNSVLAYEVVRESKDGKEINRIKRKVHKYLELVKDISYFNMNKYADIAYPQLVICGQNYEHNRNILCALKSSGNWSNDDVILFTEDRLIFRNSLQAIYYLNDNGSREWLEIPAYNEKISIHQKKLNDKCIIGIGGAGINFLKYVEKTGGVGDNMDVLAIDSDRKKLDTLKNTRVLQIGKNITQGLGTGSLDEIAEIVLKIDEEKITEQIKNYKMIYIIGSLGGSMGSQGMLKLSQISKKYQIKIRVLALQPIITACSDVRRRVFNVYMKLQDMVEKLKVYELSLKDITVDTNMEEAINIMNADVIRDIKMDVGDKLY